jgi:opacity protein-like surface antigen
MKKITFLIFILSFFSQLHSQINKGAWLFGGTGTFSSIKSSNDLGSNSEISTQINGNAGYFLIDKLVAGLRPEILWDKFKTNSNSNDVSTQLSIGPFVRYYFLPSDQRVNFFAGAGYAYGTSKVSNQNSLHSNSLSLSGGPVIFLNTSVGLELFIGYTSTKVNDDSNTKKNVVQAGIGLQFYLEKE